MNTVSIELTPQEASDLRALLRESSEKLRRSNSRPWTKRLTQKSEAAKAVFFQIH
jgi:hypothetical protein